MNRRAVAVLLSVLMLGILGAECPPPLISQQSTSEMPPPPAYVPNDATKKVLSVTARPSLLTFDTEGEVQVLALMQFNVDLLNDTVNLLDFTDSFPRVIKPMDFVAVQKDGVLFGTTLTYGPDDSAFDVDSRLGGGDGTLQSLILRVSAAYDRSPLRAMSDNVILQLALEAEAPVANVTQLVEVDSSVFQINQILVDCVDSVSRGEFLDAATDALAGVQAGLNPTIAGFIPATNTFVLEITLDVSDAGAADTLAEAIVALLGLSIVETAHPNFVVSAEATDIGNEADGWVAGKSEALVAAGVTASWQGSVPSWSRVLIGVVDTGLQVENLAHIGGSALNKNHDDLAFATSGDCAVATPTLGPSGNLAHMLANCNLIVEPGSSAALEATESSAWGGNAAAQQRVNHGTFVTGVIGGVNQAGRGDSATGGVGVLSGVGVAATAAETSGGTDSGSELSYGIVYGHVVNEGDFASMGDVQTAISTVAGRGVSIINLSLGWSKSGLGCAGNTILSASFGSVETNWRSFIASYPNILFVASAGNCGVDASNHLPGGMSSPPTNLLTVGATDPATGETWVNTNFGSTVQIAAPGVGVYGPQGLNGAGTSLYANVDGTSGAAAIVSGIAGLVQSARSSSTGEELRDLLLAGGDPTPPCVTVACPTDLTAPSVNAAQAVSEIIPVDVDVFLLVDLSGSFSEDLNNFKLQAGEMITELLIAHGSGVSVGIGRFEDFPVDPWGGDATSGFADQAYELVLATEELINSAGDITGLDEINLLATRWGNDGRESQVEALYQMATGAGRGSRPVNGAGTPIPYPAAGLGGNNIAFRNDPEGDNVRVAVLWTDAAFHERGETVDPDGGGTPYPYAYPGPHLTTVGAPSACAALTAASYKVISIISGTGDAALNANVKDLADCTGSTVAAGVTIDCDANTTTDIPSTEFGSRLVCNLSSSGVGIKDAIIATIDAVVNP